MKKHALKVLTSTSENISESDFDTNSDLDTSDDDDAYFSDASKAERNNCRENEYSVLCNNFKNQFELKNRADLQKYKTAYSFLYPNLDDPNFNAKIAEKKEFNENRYDGTVYENIKEQADHIANAEFELQPQQVFVKNYMSSYTPYNSLLVFHGLGSGKTCTSIGVTEELREHGQFGQSKKIIIVAAENVQNNFQLQLFDERNLEQVNGEWKMRGCVGNRILSEIVTKGMSREKIISQAKTLIDKYYLFVGYMRFANYIVKTMNEASTLDQPEWIPSKLSARAIHRLRSEFDNRFIVIDEIHNIRKSEDNENKRVAMCLELLVQTVSKLQFLFLSATPMYNSYREIIWIINLMNMNDRRSKIKASDIFDREDNFKPGGKELLIRKATGYVSFVRGENPYTFPYRIYPDKFAPRNTFPSISYPTTQIDGQTIQVLPNDLILSLFITTLKRESWQTKAYTHIVERMRSMNADLFGYSALQLPIESLIISYPVDQPLQTPNVKEAAPKQRRSRKVDGVNKEKEREKEKAPRKRAAKKVGGRVLRDTGELTGKAGLARVMKYRDTQVPPFKGDFEYRTKKYGSIFSPKQIGEYSAKIHSIISQIYDPETKRVSEGVILIYSQYIDAGLVPMALALEELGFTRYGTDGVHPLFKKTPTPVVDVNTMQPLNTIGTQGTPARYSMITGDPRLSPNNKFEVAGLTDPSNRNGEKVKVVLISKAGSEGIDLKFIRQAHVIDPWYNLNRIEQIIGRAVRNLSHKDLPFEKRNVEIYLHGTVIEGSDEEPADLYIYRAAQLKARKIGAVTRVLKESAVDCLIHHAQTNFSQENMRKYIKTPIRQELSSGKILSDLVIGDAPFSAACDYMNTCMYQCRPNSLLRDVENIQSYNEQFMRGNSDKLKERIRGLFVDRIFYHKKMLIAMLRTHKKYPLVQIYSAITDLIEDETETIYDRYGRTGRLVNVGDYYLFQPIELTNRALSVFERSVPLDIKPRGITYDMSERSPNKSPPELEARNEADNNAEALEIIERLRAQMDVAQKNAFGSDPRPENLGKKTAHKWEYIAGFSTKFILKLIEMMPESKRFTQLIQSLNMGTVMDILVNTMLHHFIEELPFFEKLALLQHIYTLRTLTSPSLEKAIREYFDKTTIKDPNNHVCMLLYENYDPRAYVLSNEKWTPMEPFEQSELLLSNAFQSAVSLRSANDIVGFMSYSPDSINLVFKTKKISSKRDTGARCDQALKNKTTTQLNSFLEAEIFTRDFLTETKLAPKELCVIEELLLRLFSAVKKDNRRWFLTPEMAIANQFYKEKRGD